MRAISLWQPWASAIAIGAKHNETRSWYTAYRGPLAIHAAKTKEHADYIREPTVSAAFSAAGIKRIEDLPFGCVLVTCRMFDCVRTEKIADSISPIERALGDYTPGRFAWVFTDFVILPQPIPARGSQGFWNWEHVPAPDLFQ